jgi:hypothetical protein
VVEHDPATSIDPPGDPFTRPDGTSFFLGHTTVESPGLTKRVEIHEIPPEPLFHTCSAWNWTVVPVWRPGTTLMGRDGYATVPHWLTSVAGQTLATVGALVGDLVGALVGVLTVAFVGLFVGGLTGAADGDFVGGLTGAFVGALVGGLTGAPVGALVGGLTGAFVGPFVGGFTRVPVGAFVGGFTGAPVGAFVGCLTGACVGAESRSGKVQ